MLRGVSGRHPPARPCGVRADDAALHEAGLAAAGAVPVPGTCAARGVGHGAPLERGCAGEECWCDGGSASLGGHGNPCAVWCHDGV